MKVLEILSENDDEQHLKKMMEAIDQNCQDAIKAAKQDIIFFRGSDRNHDRITYRAPGSRSQNFKEMQDVPFGRKLFRFWSSEIWSDIPKRNQSIIFTTDMGHSIMFGMNTYVVLPVDGATLAATEQDFNFLRVEIVPDSQRLIEWTSKEIQNSNLTDDQKRDAFVDYDTAIGAFVGDAKNGPGFRNQIQALDNKHGLNLTDKIDKLVNQKLEYIQTTNTKNIEQLKGYEEVWTESPCYLVKYDFFRMLYHHEL